MPAAPFFFAIEFAPTGSSERKSKGKQNLRESDSQGGQQRGYSLPAGPEHRLRQRPQSGRKAK
jgi:hypothetical protein